MLTGYDTDWYADAAMCATESVLSPIGWCDAEIRDYLVGAKDAKLDAWSAELTTN